MSHYNISNEQLLGELQKKLGKKIEENHQLEKTIQFLSKQLRESERGKSAFLSNVRNEINNPLTSIIGLADHVGKQSGEEHIRKIGAWIHQQAFELDYQMRNIMIAAEIEMGEIKPVGSQINIESFFKNQIDYLKTRTEHSNVRVKLHLKSDTTFFRTDPYLLQTVCVNLLANAIEFSISGEEVILSCWCGPETLYLQIQDFGIGIETKNLDTVFTRFNQLESGLTKTHPGQGLGLTIVKELVQILGGKIQMDSALNKGTSVALQLPALQSAPGFSACGNEWLFTEGEEF